MGAIERIRSMQAILIYTLILGVAGFAIWQVYKYYNVKAPKNKTVETVLSDGAKAGVRAGELSDRVEGVKAIDAHSKSNTEATLKKLKDDRDALLRKMSELKKDQHLHVKDIIKRLEEEGYKIEDF